MFILQNKTLKAEINDNPLELISLTKNDKEYIYQRESDWKKSWPTCFPWTGKFVNDQYIYDGKTYKMGGHGFFRQITNWKVEKYNETEIIVSWSGDEFLNIYPFKLKLEVGYRLDGENGLTNWVKITNNDSKSMPYGFGWHPAFICDDYFGKVLFDKEQELYEIPLNTIITNDMQHQTTNHLNLVEYPFEMSNCYFVKNNTTKKMMIVDPDRVVEIKTENYKGVMIWKCKDAARYICVEPWASHQDSVEGASLPLDQKPGVNILAPHKQECYELKINIIK